VAYARLDNFFGLLKKPEEVEKKIKQYDHTQREEAAKKLVRRVSCLSNINEQISNIEDYVMGASCSIVRDQGGDYEDWSNEDQVNKYQSLRVGAISLMENVQGALSLAHKVNIKDHKSIGGEAIGFPASVDVPIYLSYAEGLVKRTSSTLSRLNKHLHNQSKKARSKAYPK